MARVLVVDDEDGIRKTSAMFLRDAGHEVETAGTVAEASAKVADGDFDVIISDIVMPGDDGIRLLEFVRARSPRTQFILLTGEPTLETATDALRLGAFDYLPKPLQKHTMCRIVAKAWQQKKLREQDETLHDENRRHRDELKLLVEERTAELKNAMESIILCLSMALEKRDPYTAGHQRRVADIACVIWDNLSLPREARDGLRIAGMLHDLGQVQISADILSKPTRLSKAEFMLIKEHSISAWEILRLAEFPWPVATIVRQHHERLDGTGYPDGLKDGDILRESCILGIADVVEAMASHRPYRPALGIDAALAEILRGRGTAYWPDAVDACVKAFRVDGYVLPV